MARFGHDPKKIWVMTQAGAIGLVNDSLQYLKVEKVKWPIPVY
jgi:hypothetical protein